MNQIKPWDLNNVNDLVEFTDQIIKNENIRYYNEFSNNINSNNEDILNNDFYI